MEIIYNKKINVHVSVDLQCERNLACFLYDLDTTTKGHYFFVIINFVIFVIDDISFTIIVFILFYYYLLPFHCLFIIVTVIIIIVIIIFSTHCYYKFKLLLSCFLWFSISFCSLVAILTNL